MLASTARSRPLTCAALLSAALFAVACGESAPVPPTAPTPTSDAAVLEAPGDPIGDGDGFESGGTSSLVADTPVVRNARSLADLPTPTVTSITRAADGDLTVSFTVDTAHAGYSDIHDYRVQWVKSDKPWSWTTGAGQNVYPTASPATKYPAPYRKIAGRTFHHWGFKVRVRARLAKGVRNRPGGPWSDVLTIAPNAMSVTN